MSAWDKYTAEQIRTGADDDGNRLVIAFCRDFKELFGASAECCHSCPSFPDKVRKFKLKYTSMEKVENSGFKLKAKYEGIQMGFNGDPVSNGNLTDERAIKLLKNHPAGEGLFDQIPEDWESLTSEDTGETFEKKVKALNKSGLIALAESLNLETDGTVKELKARIIENGEEPKETSEDTGETEE